MYIHTVLKVQIYLPWNLQLPLAKQCSQLGSRHGDTPPFHLFLVLALCSVDSACISLLAQLHHSFTYAAATSKQELSQSTWALVDGGNSKSCHMLQPQANRSSLRARGPLLMVATARAVTCCSHKQTGAL
ncbi:hypothetical protein RRG08_019712 [Elysia crispata]|uniref:Uncharacterized protein n=1 Tax=Elysia crispata TaxID=231223 RepID=A0AAE1B415_9GAST|nr:hypothetical protein RRG08_019712 [Elysia crispata]